MKSRYVLGGYAAWVALLVAAYYCAARPARRGLGADQPQRRGRHRGGRGGQPARPQGAVAAARRRAQASFAAGQVSFLVAQLAGAELPFPSFADVLYLLTYPLYAAGLLIFI